MMEREKQEKKCGRDWDRNQDQELQIRYEFSAYEGNVTVVDEFPHLFGHVR